MKILRNPINEASSEFFPLVYKAGLENFEGERAWNKLKKMADSSRKDEYVYKVLNTIKTRNYSLTSKQRDVLNNWIGNTYVFLGKKQVEEECDCCSRKKIPPTLSEGKHQISEALDFHIRNQMLITENIFRAGSLAHVSLLLETRDLFDRKIIQLRGRDRWLFENSDLGRYGEYEGKMVPLDLPLTYENLTEGEKKKNPPLNKPRRGGSKKFYVYVKDPKTKRIKKVSFGDTTGLRAKINNPKARQAFAKRHDCANKKDKTKASYWSCRVPRYSHLLGLKSSFSGYW